MPKLTLREAVDILNIDCDTSRRSVNIQCPICGKGREKKLNINFDRFGPDEGVFNCVKCGFHGAALHFWAAYRGIDTTDMRAASHDFHKYMESTSHQPVNAPRKKKIVYERVDVEPAPVAVRDATYRMLLSVLDLSGKHREMLAERGLDHETIDKNQYRSYPVTSLHALADLLLARGCILEGVPPFFKDEKGKWTMLQFTGGFLIPQRNGLGQIQGLQIRLDKPTANSKYLTLSSAERPGGAKGRTYCHLAWEKGMSLDRVILTEGPLKADIISQYTGLPVLAIPGVNAISLLERALYDLKNAGLRKILIAFDMDLYENIHVQNALDRLKNMLAAYRIPHSQLVWDKNYKGLDDYLVANKKKKEKS